MKLSNKSCPSSIVKSLSFALLVTFSVSDLAQAATLAGISNPVVSSKASSFVDVSSFQVPTQYSQYKESYQAPLKNGSPAPLVILIQDAHANLSGQENLAKTLEELMNRYQFSDVFVEGGSGDVTLGPLRELMSASSMKRIAGRYLRDAEISGEEYLNLTSSQPMKLIGVEDLDLYMEGLKAYAELANQREKILDYLSSSRTAVEKLKKRHYPYTLLSYEKSANRTVSPEKLVDVAQKQGVGFSQFKEVVGLSVLLTEEKKIDFSLAQLELASLVEKIGAADAGNVARELSMGPKQKGVGQLAYLKKIVTQAKERNIALSSTPKLQSYMAYLEKFSKLDMEKLLEQSQKLEQVVYGRLLTHEAAHTLRAVDQYLSLLETAYRIQMTSDEFTAFLENTPDFPTVSWQAFLNRSLLEEGLTDSLIPLEKHLEEGRIALEKFYRAVDQRDFAFIKNLEKGMSSKMAALIAGGYHTRHLAKLLKEKGYSYVVVTPNVNSETNQAKYEKVLLSPLKRPIKTVRTVNGKALIAGIDGQRTFSGAYRIPQRFVEEAGNPKLSLAVAGLVDKSVAAARLADEDPEQDPERFAPENAPSGLPRTLSPLRSNDYTSPFIDGREPSPTLQVTPGNRSVVPAAIKPGTTSDFDEIIARARQMVTPALGSSEYSLATNLTPKSADLIPFSLRQITEETALAIHLSGLIGKGDKNTLDLLAVRIHREGLQRLADQFQVTFVAVNSEGLKDVADFVGDPRSYYIEQGERFEPVSGKSTATYMISNDGLDGTNNTANFDPTNPAKNEGRGTSVILVAKEIIPIPDTLRTFALVYKGSVTFDFSKVARNAAEVGRDGKLSLEDAVIDWLKAHSAATNIPLSEITFELMGKELVDGSKPHRHQRLYKKLIALGVKVPTYGSGSITPQLIAAIDDRHVYGQIAGATETMSAFQAAGNLASSGAKGVAQIVSDQGFYGVKETAAGSGVYVKTSSTRTSTDMDNRLAFSAEDLEALRSRINPTTQQPYFSEADIQAIQSGEKIFTLESVPPADFYQTFIIPSSNTFKTEQGQVVPDNGVESLNGSLNVSTLVVNSRGMNISRSSYAPTVAARLARQPFDHIDGPYVEGADWWKQIGEGRRKALVSLMPEGHRNVTPGDQGAVYFLGEMLKSSGLTEPQLQLSLFTGISDYNHAILVSPKNMMGYVKNNVFLSLSHPDIIAAQKAGAITEAEYGPIILHPDLPVFADSQFFIQLESGKTPNGALKDGAPEAGREIGNAPRTLHEDLGFKTLDDFLKAISHIQQIKALKIMVYLDSSVPDERLEPVFTTVKDIVKIGHQNGFLVTPEVLHAKTRRYAADGSTEINLDAVNAVPTLNGQKYLETFEGREWAYNNTLKMIQAIRRLGIDADIDKEHFPGSDIADEKLQIKWLKIFNDLVGKRLMFMLSGGNPGTIARRFQLFAKNIKGATGSFSGRGTWLDAYKVPFVDILNAVTQSDPKESLRVIIVKQLTSQWEGKKFENIEAVIKAQRQASYLLDVPGENPLFITASKIFHPVGTDVQTINELSSIDKVLASDKSPEEKARIISLAWILSNLGRDGIVYHNYQQLEEAVQNKKFWTVLGVPVKEIRQIKKEITQAVAARLALSPNAQVIYENVILEPKLLAQAQNGELTPQSYISFKLKTSSASFAEAAAEAAFEELDQNGFFWTPRIFIPAKDLPKTSVLRLTRLQSNGLHHDAFVLDGVPSKINSPQLNQLLQERLRDPNLSWQDYVRIFIEELGAQDITTNQSLIDAVIKKYISDPKSEIYQQAMTGKAAGNSARDIYLALYAKVAVQAAQLLRVNKGRASHETSPNTLDPQELLAEARTIHENFRANGVFGYVKIGNVVDADRKVGVQAVELATREGISVNVTLLFTAQHVLDNIEAYIQGLENRNVDGNPLANIHSVLSLFVSRVDIAVDPLILKAEGDASTPEIKERISMLRGKVAIAQTQLAYRVIQSIYSNENLALQPGLLDPATLEKIEDLRGRFSALRLQGANPQRLLIASSGTKKDKQPYADPLSYVLPLLGDRNLNTLPQDAFEATALYVESQSDEQLQNVADKQLVRKGLPKLIQTADNHDVWRQILLRDGRELDSEDTITADQVLLDLNELVLGPNNTSIDAVGDRLLKDGAEAFRVAEKSTIDTVQAAIAAARLASPSAAKRFESSTKPTGIRFAANATLPAPVGRVSVQPFLTLAGNGAVLTAIAQSGLPSAAIALASGTRDFSVSARPDGRGNVFVGGTDGAELLYAPTDRDQKAVDEKDQDTEALTQVSQRSQAQIQAAAGLFDATLEETAVLKTNALRVIRIADRVGQVQSLERQKQLLVGQLFALLQISNAKDVSNFRFRVEIGRELLADKTVQVFLNILSSKNVVVGMDEKVVDPTTGRVAEEFNMASTANLSSLVQGKGYLPFKAFTEDGEATSIYTRDIFHTLTASLQNPKDPSAAFVAQHVSFFPVGVDTGDARPAIIAFLSGEVQNAQGWIQAWAVPLVRVTLEQALRLERMMRALDIAA